MGVVYPNPRRPPVRWFWPILLGWISLASMAAIAAWLAVGTIASLHEHPDPAPQTALPPPS
jgi:hypothetical protein